MYQVTHYINGQKAEKAEKAEKGKNQIATLTRPLYNPSNGTQVGEVLLADSAIVDEAVTAARTAFPAWSALSATKRAEKLFDLYVLLRQHQLELATLVSREHGKTIADAEASVQRGLDVLRYACGTPSLLQGQFAAGVAAGTDNYAMRLPLGVCAGITPFNFPVMIALWMFPLSIACGNTFILKPAEKDPSAVLRLAELTREAGIPAGVVNVVQGDAVAVNALLAHADIKAVSFVGSSHVAEQIHTECHRVGKRVQAFGGAKNHCIVMPDADSDFVADTLVSAAYGSAGERCMAISVAILVGDDKQNDKLVEKISQRVRQLKIGDGATAGVDMGPLVSRELRDKVLHLIDRGVSEGASLCVDGRHFVLAGHEKGFFLGGSLFDHVTAEMRIWQEEIFGPVLCLMRAPDFTSALTIVNSHVYGNGAAILTQDPHLAREFAFNVQAGMVGINIPIPVPVAQLSFGGWKRSRFSDIHLYGAEGIQFYTQLKTVMQRWPTGARHTSFTLPVH